MVASGYCSEAVGREKCNTILQDDYSFMLTICTYMYYMYGLKMCFEILLLYLDDGFRVQQVTSAAFVVGYLPRYASYIDLNE